jgi:hypothetical protein
MSTNSNSIGLARRQKAFFLLEDTFGTIQFPVGTLDFIAPVGNASINQNPAFVDSEEVQDTLDVTNRFQNALPAAVWSLPMYLRPSGTIGSPPQGSALFRALQGATNATTTAAITTDPGATAGTIEIGTIAGGIMPETGVVTVDTEKIRYSGILRASRTATAATLTGCERGYDASTAATHAPAKVVTLSSIFYRQTTTSPSFSLWVESDHLVQGVQGASVDACDMEVNNEGAITFNFSGQGMKMVWAGSSSLSASSLATNTHLHVVDASLYSTGAYIWNYTKGAGVSAHASIATVDTVNNILYLSNALGCTGATSDVIKGYLPTGTLIGDPIESKNTSLLINGVATLIKASSLSIKAPKKYLTDEVGTLFPEDFLEDKRDISGSLRIYFRKADAKYFTKGLSSTEYPVLINFGNVDGEEVVLYMKRVKIEAPAVEFSTPAIDLTIPVKALGTVGEDSLEVILP